MNGQVVQLIKEMVSQEELIKLVKDLVSIPSYKGVDKQETEVAIYINELFKKEGIESQIVPVTDDRCNVIAKLKGTGGGKNLLLTGHLDTVPPYDMNTDLMIARVDSDHIYGRGTCDMKGQLACMILSLIAIKRANINLRGDLYFAGVIDEECKSEGTIALLKQGLEIDAAIVGEPTELNLCLGHKGLEWIEFHFIGKAAHGGMQDRAINAISSASKFIQEVEKRLIPQIKERYHPFIGCSSMNLGYIKGGTQPSTVAGECILQIDRRWVPSENYADVLKEYQDIIDELHNTDPNFKCEMKIMEDSVMRDGYIHASMETDLDHPLCSILEKHVKSYRNISPKKIPFPAWSDGGLLTSYGKIPTIIFGPGSLTLAHTKDENIEIEGLYPATLVYTLTALEYCEI